MASISQSTAAPDAGAAVAPSVGAPAADPAPEEPAAAALLRRLLPERHARLFDLRLVASLGPDAPHGGFRARTEGCRILVDGTSPVELAAGAHWWLKHRANCSVSWDLTGGPQVDPAAFDPARLAALEAAGGGYCMPRAVPLTFYQNVVTMSYSFAFWDWDR
jgi:alpha-N-acetylglucosaminidase